MNISCRPDYLKRLPLLGAEVDIVTPAEVIDFVAGAVAGRRKVIVANHNLHSLYYYKRRADMRAFYAQADLIEIDSTPMIAWARLLGHEVSRAHRSTYLDFREDFWRRAAAHGWRVYHLGGAPEHAEPARSAILARHPEVQLEARNGYFDMNGPDNQAVLADIAAKKPDVLLVGMGMPRQETWILNNLGQLPDCAILPVGGAFDYEAGATYTPPRWAGQLGIEWLVRFFHDPRRLFERYFLEPWVLIPEALKDVTRRPSR
ncbi:MAG: WecB/TagA/CpsF family glycosyltransferase [Asticcacaulis sp.]